MTIDEIKNKYGSMYKFFKEVGLSQGYYTQFKRLGFIPIKTQERIELLTNGNLKANYAHCKQVIEVREDVK